MNRFILSKLNPMWVRDVVHYMCEYRIWTKSDEELFKMFISMNGGVNDWLSTSY